MCLDESLFTLLWSTYYLKNYAVCIIYTVLYTLNVIQYTRITKKATYRVVTVPEKLENRLDDHMTI